MSFTYQIPGALESLSHLPPRGHSGHSGHQCGLLPRFPEILGHLLRKEIVGKQLAHLGHERHPVEANQRLPGAKRFDREAVPETETQQRMIYTWSQYVARVKNRKLAQSFLLQIWGFGNLQLHVYRFVGVRGQQQQALFIDLLFRVWLSVETYGQADCHLPKS